MRDQLEQVAEEIPFDNTSNGFAADEAQSAIEEARDTGFTLGTTEAFNDDSTQSTTSNSWVTKSNFPYTSSTLAAGDYIIDFTAELGQSDKEKDVGYRVQWREGTSGTWLNLTSIINGLSVDDGYELRTGFRIVTVSTSTVIQVRVQWGQTDEGGTGRIRNAGIKIKRKAL